MPSNERQQLRRLIQDAFSDEELGNFCFDYFPQVYNEFTTGMPKSQKVRLLVAHAESGSRLPDLHAALKRENPQAYDNTFPKEGSPARPVPQQTVTRNPRQIFISHASADAEFAHRFAADLRAQGWQTWIAPESIRPGEKWGEAIDRGLEECGVFVLVLTEAAVNSNWVRKETYAAINMETHGELRYIPVALEEVKSPPTWQSNQWIRPDLDDETKLATLLHALDPKVYPPPVPPQPSPPLPKAPVWSRIWQWLQGLPSVAWAGSVGVLIVLLFIFWPDGNLEPAMTPTRMVAAQTIRTETPTAAPTDEPMAVNSATPTPVPPTQTPSPVPATETPTGTATATPTIDPNVPPADAELGNSWTRPKDGMVMVYVPPPDVPFAWESGVDAPTEGYWIDKYEVSNAQYQLCVDAGACEPSAYVGYNRFNGNEYPVVGVSAFDADAYSEWVGGALPTMMQWWYAAVGDSGFGYPWGNELDGTRLNFCDVNCEYGWQDRDWDDGYQYTAPVNSFLEGGSWVGAVNMVGNVWEWTASWYDEETRRALMGGSWSYSQGYLRAGSYKLDVPGYRGDNNGFRVVVRRPLSP